ncbi:MAG: WD40 repeat domain-containing serine/threonine protein kinase [Kofleriaceae bacterium]
MSQARGHDDTIASGDVDVGSAQTVGSSSAALPAIKHELPVVPFESYVRIDEYARGGLGRIIRAKDERTGRFVAIKEMLADNADAAARFVREAMVTANLQHPAIVPVYEVGQWPDGKPFYAMKLVRGRALNEVIDATESLDDRLALVSHVAAVADALAYAHGERVIHRDLKPHNVLCGAFGETVVIDWGLARRLDESEAASVHRSISAAPGETYVGAVMGTPSYMPPEQARGERADQQSDVYAIGAILYHLLAGRPPHVGKDIDALLDRVKNATPAKLPVEVPPDLVAIVERAMARERSTRYPSAAELASDLRRFMTGQLVLAHHYTPRQRLARFVSRNRAAVAVAATALVLGAAGATIAIRNIVIARGEATASRDEATASRDEARDQLVASYVDRAGFELVSGHPARSLAYSIAAAQLAGLTPETRLVAGRALDQLPAVRWWRDSKVAVGLFVPGSHDLLLSGNALVRWDPDADQVRWRLPAFEGGDLRLVGRDAFAFARDARVTLAAVADGTTIVDLAGSGERYNGLVGADVIGRWLAAPTDKHIDLFDVSSRSFVASVPFAKAVRSPKVSTDGQRIIASSAPPAVSILDRSGKVVGTFEAFLGSVELAGDEILYTPPLAANGIARVVIADWSGKVRLDLSVGIVPIHAFAADAAGGRIAVATNDGLVQVRSLSSGDILWQTTVGDQVESVMFDGDLLRVVASTTGTVAFDVGSGIEVERASQSGGHVVVSEDRTRNALLAFGVGCAVWAGARGEIAPIAPTSARVIDLVLAPDDTVITGGEDGELHVLRAGQTSNRVGTGSTITGVARADDGTLVAASIDGTVVVRDRDGRELRRFAAGSSIQLSPDGRLLLAAIKDGPVGLWDIATGTRVRELGAIGSVRSLRWSSDGRRVAAMTATGAVTVWNVDGTVVRELPSPTYAGGNIALSRDGRWLARAGEPTDTLFSLDGGTDRPLLDVRPGAVLFVAFSDDDRSIVAAGTGFVSTWDVATGASRLRLATNSWITAAAFIDDGRYVIGTGMDRRVHLWNAESGAELLAFTVHSPPRRIILDRSGSRVAIVTSRGAVAWKVPSFAGTVDELQEMARCRLDVEIVEGHLRPRSIDIPACNRSAR